MENIKMLAYKKNIKNVLLDAPENEMTATTKNLIRSWSEDFKPIEVLKTLDYVIHYGGTNFLVGLLTILYENILKHDNVNSFDVELVAKNTYRKTKCFD